MCRGLLIIYVKPYFSNANVLVPGGHSYTDHQIFIVWMLMRKLGRCNWARPQKRNYAKIEKGHAEKRYEDLRTFSHAQIIERLGSAGAVGGRRRALLSAGEPFGSGLWLDRALGTDLHDVIAQLLEQVFEHALASPHCGTEDRTRRYVGTGYYDGGKGDGE